MGYREGVVLRSHSAKSSEQTVSRWCFLTLLCVFLGRLPNESPNKRCGPSGGEEALRREFAKARCAGLHVCVTELGGDLDCRCRDSSVGRASD